MNWDEFKQFLQTTGKDSLNSVLGSSPVGAGLQSAINSTPTLLDNTTVGHMVEGAPTGQQFNQVGPDLADDANSAIQDVATPGVPVPMDTPADAPTTPTPEATPDEEEGSEAASPGTSPSSSPKASPSALGLPETNNDNLKRQQAVQQLEKQRKLNIIPEALAGAADAVAGSASAFGANVSQGHLKDQKATDEGRLEQEKGQFEENLKNDPNSDVSKQYQGLLAKMLQKDPSDPMIAGRSASQIAEQIPAVEKLAAMQNQKDMKELQLKQLQTNREIALGQRHDLEQDRLENQAMQRITGLRGDKSLQDAEAKRDAAITVYNTIDGLQKKGQAPSKLVYYDLLGQMWKARTGASPTDQAIKDLDQKTFKGNLANATTFFTGKPAAATTQGVLQNIKDFATESGQQADQFHQNYMAPHMLKPQGLDDSRWAPISNTARGVSFADATKQAANQPNAAPVTKSIGGKTYVQKDGKWYQQ